MMQVTLSEGKLERWSLQVRGGDGPEVPVKILCVIFSCEISLRGVGRRETFHIQQLGGVSG